MTPVCVFFVAAVALAMLRRAQTRRHPFITEIIFDPHFQRRPTITRLAAATGFHEMAFHGNRTPARKTATAVNCPKQERSAAAISRRHPVFASP